MKALLFSVTTLYSKAFGLKDGIKDKQIDKFKAIAMYNQAIIYYHYKRYPLALGIANKAVRYQQQKGIIKSKVYSEELSQKFILMLRNISMPSDNTI